MIFFTLHFDLLIPENKRNGTVKFHILDRSMNESVTTFQSVVEAEQQNFGPQEKQPLAESENPARRINQE